MAAHVTRVHGEEFFKKFHIRYTMKWMRWMIRCGIVAKEDGNVRSMYEEDEGTDCEDGDSDTDW